MLTLTQLLLSFENRKFKITLQYTNIYKYKYKYKYNSYLTYFYGAPYSLTDGALQKSAIHSRRQTA